jgi:hypothetical protein
MLNLEIKRLKNLLELKSLRNNNKKVPNEVTLQIELEDLLAIVMDHSFMVVCGVKI